MSDSLICGAEEPLSVNPELYAVDEDRNEIALSEFQLPGVFRYSFLPEQQPSSAGVLFLALLRALRAQIGGGVWWLVGWPHRTTGDLRVRSHVYLSRLERAGWRTRATEGLGIALKEVPAD